MIKWVLLKDYWLLQSPSVPFILERKIIFFLFYHKMKMLQFMSISVCCIFLGSFLFFGSILGCKSWWRSVRYLPVLYGKIFKHFFQNRFFFPSFCVNLFQKNSATKKIATVTFRGGRMCCFFFTCRLFTLKAFLWEDRRGNECLEEINTWNFLKLPEILLNMMACSSYL